MLICPACITVRGHLRWPLDISGPYNTTLAEKTERVYFCIPKIAYLLGTWRYKRLLIVIGGCIFYVAACVKVRDQSTRFANCCSALAHVIEVTLLAKIKRKC